MRYTTQLLGVLAATALTACDFWPRQLESLADSIGQQVSGEATVWLAGGDVVIIDVANSPLYGEASSSLEAVATDIAQQTVAFTEQSLESIVITFHQGVLSEEPERMRSFVFMVQAGIPVLQPFMDLDATGPLSAEEIDAAMDRLGDSLGEDRLHCARKKLGQLAAEAGDPETFDPGSNRFLPTENWAALDAFGKRLVLVQALSTQAVFDCAGR